MSPATRIIRSLPASIADGALATVTMDAAMMLASRLAPDSFAADKIGLDRIGRWAVHLVRGHVRHADISAEPRLRSELAAGLATHYLTGIALTQIYLALLRRAGLKPRPVGAVAYGLATAALPLLIVYPSMGYGCCGLRSGDAARLLRVMLLGHAAFGVGIALGTSIPWGRAAAE